ncbi:PPE family protein [Mycolicibacter arupensis]|uniref:PPE family protein n=1 Tax=Mycolicibacter arupensis TaxID=342002 RepID=A0A0F5MT96_9MYCO|nr:PPE family protein [Mycolicibacter arupensis]KKB97819.1 hypothetical protein WR43_17480 [Mycolicibacter arupensis]MCV7277650.1 PPE family protein [Mycolicibacter arupensis]OQZ99999.1 PPE family protein [Mycolicibacter arupensis]TXI53353.1 MAG: PPE family protein [Mycolicibacter arupensis]
MTTPIWMALPPEVHSTLLSSGAGPGALMSAAQAWTALSNEYAATAAELTALLTSVQAGAWQGPTAASYVAAHTPYLTWLNLAGLNSAGAAAQLETAAGSYTAALAAMPTLAELAANRTTLSVLVATNFFGINAIPIAVTEADYARMWIQAATTMSVYQAVSTAALAATPQTAPAPSVLNRGALAGSAEFTDPIEEWLSWSEHFSSMYRMLKQVLANPLGTLIQIITDFAANPAAAVTTWMPLFYLFAYAATFAVLGTPLYAAVMGPAAASSAIPIALGLSGLAYMAQVPVEVSPPAAPQILPSAVMVPTPPAGAVTTPPAPAPAPANVTAAPAPPVPSPPPASGVPPLYYAVSGGGPGVGFGPPMQQRALESARRSRSIGETAEAAAVAAAARKSRTRRRRGADVKARGYRYEFMTAEGTAAAPPVEQPARAEVSRSGSAPFGSTGTTVGSGLTEPAGLATLAADAFGNGAATPMLPGGWTEENPRNDDRETT